MKILANKILCACGCGKSLSQLDKKGRPRKYIHNHHWIGIKRAPFTHEHRANIKKARARQAGRINWQGGKSKMSHGYVRIWKPNHPTASYGYVLEHHLVMEDSLGRYLNVGEVVHHINHRRDDNRIENLKLFSSHGEHMREAH